MAHRNGAVHAKENRLQPLSKVGQKTLVTSRAVLHDLTKNQEVTRQNSIRQIVKPSNSLASVELQHAEYSGDIFMYLRSLEADHCIGAHFLDGHKITPRQRHILIDYLIQIHEEFKLNQDTLHQCVWIVDRYLERNRTLCTDELQMLGAAALLLACKYEEITYPSLRHFVNIGADAYDRAELLAMERDTLSLLDCQMGRPHSIVFLRIYCRQLHVAGEVYLLSKYLLELAFFDVELVTVRPSNVAAVVVAVAHCLLYDDNDLERIWVDGRLGSIPLIYNHNKPVSHLAAKLVRLLLVGDRNSKYYDKSVPPFRGITQKYSKSRLFMLVVLGKLKPDIVYNKMKYLF